MRKAKLYFFLFLCSVAFANASRAVVETLSTGSYIINMGVVPQTTNNAIKPYGLVYDLIKTYKIPIKWVIGQSKGKDGADFNYNGVAYKGGTFIIPAEFMNATTLSRISAFSVTGTTTTSPLTVDVTYTLTTAPRWTLNIQNWELSKKFLLAANIPSSAWCYKYPCQLNSCDDIFMIPHACPTWSNYGYLYNWVRNNRGAVWASCQSVSGLENLYNPSNSSQQLNFLANNVGSPGNALIKPQHHNNPTPPFTHQYPTNPGAQYMGKTDDAHLSGAEQVYLPKPGGGWRTTTQILAFDPTQSNCPGQSPGPAALIAFGRAYGNSSYGWVMYEGGHDVTGTTADRIAAMRAFFNFSFRAAADKAPILASISGSSNITTPATYSVSASSPVSSSLTYQWSSSCGGTFSNPTGSSTTFTPPTVSAATNCVIKVVVSDACRSSFITKVITITPPVAPPNANNDSKTVACGADSVTLNVLSNDNDPYNYALSFVSFTPANGVTPGGSFFHRGNGNVTFIPNDNFVGTQTINYTITNGSQTDNATISITVGTVASAPVANADTIVTWKNVLRVRKDVKANDQDVNGLATSIVRVITGATKGATSVNLDGSIDYLPNLGATGTDSFVYQLTSTNGLSDTARVRININTTACNSSQSPIGNVTVINASQTNTGDMYIRQGDNGKNYGTCSSLYMTGMNGDAKRPCFKFDLTGIPANAIIDSAKFILTAVSGTSTPSYTVNVHRITSSWSEGSACGGAGTPNWSTLNTQFNTTASASTNVDDAGVYSWNVKSLVEGWVANSSTNYGMMLKFATENWTSYNLKYFASKEYSDAGCRPKLLVSYHTPGCVNVPTAAPLANPDFATTTNLTPVTIPTATNDVDVAGTKTYSLVSTPSSGTASINSSTGVVTYTPNSSFNGVVSFNYRVLNTTTSLADTARVYVTVLNGPINAVDDYPAGDSSGVVQTINVKANDVDPESPGPLGNGYTVTIMDAPSNGTATVNANGQVIYTPVAQFSGYDTLLYQICEPAGNGCFITYCDTARVFIKVWNRKPTPKNDTTSTPPCTPKTINILANDTDPENHSLTVGASLVLSPASAGTVVNNNDGTITFTPAPGFTGQAKVKYTVTDNGNPAPRTSDTALVVINMVIGVNNKPIALNDFADTLSMDEVNYVQPLENDTDPDGNTLSKPQIIIQPAHGNAVVLANGMIEYTPRPGFAGKDSLVYRISDSVKSSATCALVPGLYDTAVVYFFYKPVNTVYAINDENSTLINTVVSGNVITNDFDLEGDVITFSGFLDASNNAVGSGTITVSGRTPSGTPVANAGILAINSNGTYAYTPAINFIGVMEVPYAIQDDALEQAYDTAVLVITVTPKQKDANSIIANNDENTTYGFPVTGNVKDNDRDPQGHPFNVTTYVYDTNGDGTNDATGPLGTPIIVGGKTSAGNPTSNAGILTLNTNGTYTYSPAVDFNGEIDIVYTICDTLVPPACQTAHLHITVFPNMTPLNDPPFAGDDFVTTTVGVPVTGNFIGNDRDPNGDPLSLNGTTINPFGPANTLGTPVTTNKGGTVQYFTNGTYTYTPPAGYTGPDYVNYTICDVTTVAPQPLCADAQIHMLVDSIGVFAIAGNVFNDGNGLTDNTVNGPGTNTGTTTLRAVLYNNTTGQVFTSAPVAANGAYSIPNVPRSNNYTIYLTTTATTNGQTATPTLTLPTGWVRTGETIGTAAGSDGQPNGILSIGTLNANVTNANFGVERIPMVNAYTLTPQLNPGGTERVSIPAAAFSGNDPEDGTYTGNLTGRTVTITQGTNGNLYYNNVLVPGGTQTITSFDPTKVSVDPTGPNPTGFVAVTPTFTYTTLDNAGFPAVANTVTVPLNASLCLNARVYLEGALIQNGGVTAADGRPLMRDNLRNSPFTGQNHIPTSDPYTFATPFVDVTNQFNPITPQSTRPEFQEVTSPAVFTVTGQNAIVDWVYVELRSKANNATIVATRSGLVQRDGDIVDVDGVSCLSFPGLPIDSYYVAVRHRNHLGAMTRFAQTPAALQSLVDLTVPTTPIFDFGTTLNANDYTGLGIKSNVSGTYRALWMGNANADKKVRFQAPSDDIGTTQGNVLFFPNNSTFDDFYDFAHGYFNGDINMNGKARFQAPGDDIGLVQAQVLFYPLNTTFDDFYDFLLEQLP